MKILLVSNYAPERQESMLRYAELLRDGLSRRGHAVVLLAPPALLRRFAGRWVFAAKWLGYIDKFILFAPLLKVRARAADVVHICDHSNALYVGHIASRPHIVTCHDLLAVRSARGHFRENPVSRSGRVLQALIARGLQRAQRIVCVSEKTQQDVMRELKISPDRISVVYSALHWSYAPASPEEREPVLRALNLGGGRLYFIHVGADHWYKNRLAVLPIFRELRTKSRFAEAALVFAGQPLSRRAQNAVREQGLEGHVLSVTEPANEQLRMLYSGSCGLIFPSLEEGFGWPILEAQACGCPVFTSNRAPMRDVAGPDAVLIDPRDPKAAAALIADGLGRAPALREAGYLNLRRFETDAMLDGYLAAYARALDQRPRATPKK